jgi:hypothetical protein
MGRLYFFLCVLLFLGACEKQRTDQVPELSFRVNQNILGESFRNEQFGFAFCPPQNCQSLSKESLTEAGKKLLDFTQADSFHFELVYAALNPQEQFVCMVTGIENLRTEMDMKKYLDAIKLKMGQYDIRPSIFNYQGFKVQQVLIMMPDKIIFKLIIPQPEKKSFQIDYIVPQVYYKNNLEAIESSIGSLTKL